jgi:hypothetical protein
MGIRIFVIILFLSKRQRRHISIAGTFALLVARNGTKLDKTSLSTDGDKVPAYGKCRICLSIRYIIIKECGCEIGQGIWEV